MTNRKAVLISLVCALVALLVVFVYINKKERSILQQATLINVVVASRNLPEGTILETADLEIAAVPKKFVQPGSYSSISDLEDKVLGLPLLKETQLLESMFRQVLSTGIATKIPAGKRAYSIAINEVTAVAGLVEPGNFVDIFMVVEIGETVDGRNVTEDLMIKTILQNIMVLAINQTSAKSGSINSTTKLQHNSTGSLFSPSKLSSVTDNEKNKLRTLSLALTLKEAQLLALSQEVGSLSVALRSEWDKGQTEPLSNLTARELLGVKKRVLPRSRPAWVEIQGSEVLNRY